MHHIMIDLETLGTASDAPILQIGAVAFRSDELSFEYDPDCRFKANIDLMTALANGTPSAETLDWWRRRGHRAPIEGHEPLDSALIRLRDWIRESNMRSPTIWSRGSMDINILEHAYPAVLGDLAPWSYWQIRDARTLDEIASRLDLPKLSRAGTHHDALDDAAHQARQVLQVFAALEDLPE